MFPFSRALMAACVAALSLLALPTMAEESETVLTPERVVWRRTPIAITLTVGQERLVHFDDSVSVGLPSSLTSVLRSQSINGTVYWLAQQPFERTRVMVRSESGGPLYVLDLTAQEAPANSAPLPDVHVMLDQLDDDTGGKGADASAHELSWGYVALTRFAAQQLYAPARLISTPRGVVKVPVSDQPVDLVRGRPVRAELLASWKAGALYVTAVQLRNQSTRPIVLDPRELRGRWLAATFQHNRLLAAGDEADTTVVYVLSHQPLAASW